MPLLLIEEKAQKEIPLKLSKKVSIKKHSTETKLNSINKQGLEEELHQKMKEMKVNDCQ